MERGEPICLLNGMDNSEFFTEFVDGFDWVGGDNALTNGIWKWSRPFVLKDIDGREIVVILMDSEGGNKARDENDAEQDACIDAQYFSICGLASSVLVYNVIGEGTPNKENLDSLLRYTKYGIVVNNRSSPFQNLFFVRRNLPQSQAGVDDMKQLAKFSKQAKFGIILKNSNVNVSCYKLPAPNKALADSNVHKQKFLNGECTIEEVGPDFLDHLTRQFKMMLPMNEQNGRIDDNVLKSRMLETGQRHLYTCEEFHSLLKNIFQTFKDVDFIDPDEFPSLWQAKRAKEAALYHIIIAVNNDKRTKRIGHLDLRTINELFNEHISVALGIYKLVHWTCSEVEAGKENEPRGKYEHFVAEGKAFLAACQEFYNEYCQKNGKKEVQSLLKYLFGGATGGYIGGSIGIAASIGADIMGTATFAALASNPITAVCGFGFSIVGAVIGFGLVKRSINNNMLNSPNFIQMFTNEKAEELGTLYAYRIHTNLATRKFVIFDDKYKRIKSGNIPNDLESFFAENWNHGN